MIYIKVAWFRDVSIFFPSKLVLFIMVRLSCGVEITRLILFGLNVLFVLFGLTIFGFGIYVKASKKFDIALSGHISAEIIGAEAIEVVGIILIVVGIFTVLLSVFGCVGM